MPETSPLNSVRIIGGEWRRRILRFPAAADLRPTPDRVRETLFNWLGQDLSGAACLDLFAGSGALGFEAASRGASRVVLVEHSLHALQALESNARLLGIGERLQIVRADAQRFLAAGVGRFDVLFLDPPFHQGWIERLAPMLAGVLSDDAAIYVEAERFLPGCGEWRTVRHGHAGRVFYHLMQRGEKDGAE